MQHFKLKPSADTTYFGGKSGSGTYQTIINQIPPHDVFVSGFLGHCGILRHKRPASFNIGVELNPDVVADWKEHSNLKIYNNCFLDSLWILNRLKGDIFIYLDPPYPYSSIKSKRDRYGFKLL